MAEIISRERVRKEFDENELIALKEEYFSKSANLDDLIEEFDAVAKEFKERIKNSKIDIKHLQTEIRRGGEEIEVDVRGIPDYENGKMEFFDLETGEQYHQFTRRLKPNEKEMQINELPQMRKVHNG